MNIFDGKELRIHLTFQVGRFCSVDKNLGMLEAHKSMIKSLYSNRIYNCVVEDLVP